MDDTSDTCVSPFPDLTPPCTPRVLVREIRAPSNASINPVPSINLVYIRIIE